jgi:hypothetical protein
MDAGLLEEIGIETKLLRITRSAFLASAVRNKIKARDNEAQALIRSPLGS